MVTVLLVGLGGIGFRHFQAILNCKSDIELYAVDVEDRAIDRAREYVVSIHYSKSVSFLKNTDNLKDRIFEVVIIATSSKVRKSIFYNIAKRNIIKYLIFEKVLFTQIDDYYEVKELLQEKEILAYVNCTGRENRDYQKLKEKIEDYKKIHFYYRGSNWGLACNAIHKIDLFSYLTNASSEKLILDGNLLENKIYESKRNGYIEFFGSFSGKIGDNVSFVIECDHGNNEVAVDIYTEDIFYSVREGKEMLISENGLIRTEYFEVEYISQTTTEIVDNLINKRKILLPSYEDSMNIHIPFIKMLLKKMDDITGIKNRYCNIT